MTLQIERMSSDMSVHDNELALTPAQVEQLVALVLARLEDRAREALRARDATHVRAQALPPLGAER
jgi:hypothetical protein